MTAVWSVVRAGLVRGRIELRQNLTNREDLWNIIFPTALFLIVMIFMRGATVAGTGFSLGSRTLPSVLGMGIAFGGLVNLAAVLAIERKDGTLLRAKAIPNGMAGYVIAKIVSRSGLVLVGFALQLGSGLLFFDGLALNTVSSWLLLVAVLGLGLVATLPLGAIFGSLMESPRNMGLLMLPIMGLVATSGIFYPITGYPVWLQVIAQIFPIYWLGLGMRSAMLPADLAVAELGHSWHHWETFAVLSVWAVLGMIIAPAVLRRMARRESGSNLARRRERALRRVG